MPLHLAQCHCCHLLAGKGHPAHPAAAGECRPELEGVWPANKGLAEIGKSFGSCAFTLPDSVPRPSRCPSSSCCPPPQVLEVAPLALSQACSDWGHLRCKSYQANGPNYSWLGSMEPQALGLGRAGWCLRVQPDGPGGQWGSLLGLRIGRATVLWAGCPHPGFPHSRVVESYLPHWPHAPCYKNCPSPAPGR